MQAKVCFQVATHDPVYTLPDIGHKSFDPGRELVELGRVPLPGGAAPAGEVGRRAHGHGERVQRLRDHGEPEEGEDLEEVVRAGDEPEQAACRDLVPLLVVAVAAAAVAFMDGGEMWLVRRAMAA